MDANVIYSKASVERKPEYRQQTLILQDGEHRWVRKIAVGQPAEDHIREYQINLERLTATLKRGHRVGMVPCRVNGDGSVDFPYLTTLTLAENLENKRPEEYLKELGAFCDALVNSFDTQPFEASEAFRDFFGIVPETEGEIALSVANADLNFDNVFSESDGTYTIIDYEWILPFSIPVSYLIYRALMLDSSFNAFSGEERRNVLNAIGVDEALEAQYHEMEMAFLRYISPEEYKLDYFARIPGARQNSVYDFDYLSKLPDINRKLSDDLSRELQNAVDLSNKLQQEQGQSVRLSAELEREQQTNVRLSNELEREQQNNARISAELERECREAVRLSGELKRELEVSTTLSGELAKHIDEYNEYASKLWFRGFRKLGRAKRKLHDALRQRAQKNRVIWKGWKGLSYLLHYGPVALVQKLKQRKDIRLANQQCAERLMDNATVVESSPEISVPEDVCFSILVPLYNTPEIFLREMIQSVLDQTYGNWELCLADGSDSEHPEVGEVCMALAEQDRRIVYKRLERNGGISENTNACIDMATGDYIALFDHDDLLHSSALYENARVIHERGADFIYSDEIVFASPNREKLIATHFKPDYSPESLLSNNYICHLSVFKRSLLDKTGRFRKDYDGSQDHDIILRLTDAATCVAHIPKVLYLWRSHPTSVASDIQTKTYAITAGRNAVRDFLASKRHIDAIVESTPEYPTMYHVQFPIDGKASVAVITDATGKNQKRALAALEELRQSTGYAKASFYLITDANGAEWETGYEMEPGVIQIRLNEKNRAKRLNAAVKQAQGDYLVFLDAELGCANVDWVEQLLMFAQQDGIGAVGGKIYFTDQTLRQAGLILGLGSNRLVGRSHFRMSRENAGYFGQLAIAGDVSAVSLECMMIQRERFEKAGGFDGQYLDTLLDVDLCLRLIGAGLRNVYTPFALFTGGQSNNFGLDYGAQSKCYASDADRLRTVWADTLKQPDPYYNPNLTLDHSDYRVRV